LQFGTIRGTSATHDLDKYLVRLVAIVGAPYGNALLLHFQGHPFVTLTNG
jgi:hypothetical protein